MLEHTPKNREEKRERGNKRYSTETEILSHMYVSQYIITIYSTI